MDYNTALSGNFLKIMIHGNVFLIQAGCSRSIAEKDDRYTVIDKDGKKLAEYEKMQKNTTLNNEFLGKKELFNTILNYISD